MPDITELMEHAADLLGPMSDDNPFDVDLYKQGVVALIANSTNPVPLGERTTDSERRWYQTIESNIDAMRVE